MTTVSDAIAARRSVRGFLDRPVAPDLLHAIVTKAARAPSGGNLQPWHVDLVSGESLRQLKAIMREALAAGRIEPAAYAIYPPALGEPYRTRRFAVGEALYAALGVARDDREGRRRAFTLFSGGAARLYRRLSVLLHCLGR